MKFIDEATITVLSGHGGKGCVSFRREKHIPRGGPDGGDGGKGGNVILKTTSRKRTLYHFQFERNFKAQNGRNGSGNQRTGRDGEDIIIEIPPGTLVKNADNGEIIKDFVEPEETFILAKGGRGGRGNKRFATSTNRAPRFAQDGEPGQALTLKLELKLIADVGIIGLPNAGKSTLLRAISSATPRVGAYPFTTLSPNLGTVYPHKGEPFVVADIPGLIEGSHRGAGLGIQFLRHIERTRILVHLIDAASIKPESPLSDYETIEKELSLYSKTLAEKPRIVALNKMDSPGSEQGAEAFRSTVGKIEVFMVSAMTGKGIEALKTRMVQLLDEI